MNHRIRTAIATSLILSLGACATPSSWRAVVVHRTTAPIERIRTGHPDPTDAHLQAVSVDQAGEVALMHFDREEPRAEVLYRNGTELTGLAIADVDPTIPGEEIYVGGYLPGKTGEEDGGAVYQIAVSADPSERVLVQRIWTGKVYVHSLEIVEPQQAGAGRSLLVSTYAGRIHSLEPAGAAWRDTLLHTEPLSADPEKNKIKDVGFLVDTTGQPRHLALVAFKGGRLMRFDLHHPEAAAFVHEEPGGLSRVTPDAEGGAYVTGYAGRLMHFTPNGDGFAMQVLDQEGADSGLRGAVLGTFPVTGGTAHLAVFGFHKLCRALVPRLGVLDPYTLYVDVDKGHTLDAADLVPGNGSDEILLGGYSRCITMLTR